MVNARLRPRVGLPVHPGVRQRTRLPRPVQPAIRLGEDPMNRIDEAAIRVYAEKVVAAGAAWLDVHKPGWPELITRPIDVRDVMNCPLAQIFGSYGEGAVIADKINGYSHFDDSRNLFLTTRGFAYWGMDDAAPYVGITPW